MKPIEVVDKLNELIWGENAEHTENFHLYFSYNYYTTYEQIMFEDMVLWCSENDERSFNEEINDYEDLLQFCKRQFCYKGNKMLILNKLINS